jgi:hypothetical protein
MRDWESIGHVKWEYNRHIVYTRPLREYNHLNDKANHLI